MLSDAERDALEDIRDNIARATRFVAGLDLGGFLANDKTFYAATRCLEVISEASRRLPPAFKERFPEFPWKQVAGSGSIYRHNYENIQEHRIWATIHEALPPLSAPSWTRISGSDLRASSPARDTRPQSSSILCDRLTTKRAARGSRDTGGRLFLAGLQ